MAEFLRQWLQEVGLDVKDLEQDFANGYMFGKLLHLYNLQPDISAFLDKEKPGAFINNYAKLQPTLIKLGINLDTRMAQSLIDKQPGLASKVLYSIKQALNSRSKDCQAIDHTGRTIQQFGVRMQPSRGLLDVQNYKSQQTAYQAGNLKFFEDVMRKSSRSPNAMMEALHLKRFADAGSRQAEAAAELTAAEEASREAKRAAFINSERKKLAAARADKANKLSRDKAVHAAILNHQDDVERQELSVEMAISELNRHKQQLKGAAAAADAAAGIDAFEMTLKRLGAESVDDEMDESADCAESPAATLNRIRTFAPTAAKLAESGAEYLATIKARRHEELAGRKEREARRKKLLVEQQAARTAAEQRVEADSLLEVLVRKSAEEQKLGQRLWQLRQEKAAMEADRQLREEQYAARRDKDWEETLRREIQLHRSMKVHHEAATHQELAAWREQQHQRAAAKAAAHTAMGRQLAWQLVQLAERMIEYRAATAGQKVPQRDWRAWLALFTAGDPSLGSPVITQNSVKSESHSASSVMSAAELQDYLVGRGEWASAPDTAGNTSGVADVAASSAPDTAAAQHRSTLGRMVAELTAFAQKLRGHAAVELSASFRNMPEGPSDALAMTAADAASQQPHIAAQTVRSIPLKLAVTGGPFSGKSTVARALAQRFGLKLLVPGQLVADAVAAAQVWEQQRQQDMHQQQPPQEQPAQRTERNEQQAQPSVVTEASAEPTQHVLLGCRALEELRRGIAVSDQLLVDLLMSAMVEVKNYTAPPPEPSMMDTKAAKGGKATSKTDAALSTNKAAPPPANPEAAFAVPLPAHLMAGTPGRGCVIDGFPANATQAMLLEKSLTGLDTGAEQALVDGASVVAPPPPDALPQLDRPLISGLDAVILLGCDDEGVAVKRALGRRLDPITGRIYHLDYDPPPTNAPGLAERLVVVAGDDDETKQVPQRLSSYSAAVGPLSQWLSRFRTLRRPLDGTAELTEVLAGVGDIVSGILVAKGAAHAAQSAAEAAQRARDSAEKAREFAQAAQGYAEGAARELLSAKKAEIQATALLSGGKNPDPASAEILKAQAAAKCADQLKVCRASAADAAHHADRAHASSEQAAAAVQRCKLAVGDAVVSADAEAAASRAAADAECAANAAADAAKKAEAAKQLSETYVAEAERWFAATDVPADAAVPSAQQLSVDVKRASSVQSGCSNASAPVSASAAASAVVAAAVGSSKEPTAPPGPGQLPAALVPALNEEWQLLERVYIEGMTSGFSGLRKARHLALNHVARNCSWFQAFLKRRDNKQQLLQSFIERFNAVELDMRKAKETQGELLLRCEELRDALWAVCDAKHEEAEAARLKLANDGSAAEHVGLLGQHLTSLVQVEFDRFLSTCQFLFSYCHYSKGIYHPPGGDRPLCPLPTSLTAAAAESGKTEAAIKGTPPPPAYLVALQQKLPQLAAALKAAATAAAATQTNALALVDDLNKKAAAAAINAAAAANTAAAAAAAAAAASDVPVVAHRAATASAKGSAVAAAPAAATVGKAAYAVPNSKVALSSEEAAAAAAAAAAAVAALPDPAALATVSNFLQNMLSQEAQLLQQRLSLLGSKAAAIVDEIVQLQATANGRLAEWQQQRYVAECGSVAALEKVLKAAAVAGQQLSCDLRLEDEFLVVDESQLLVPPAPVAPAPRPLSPAAPPGVLTVSQLRQLSATLQQAASGGFLALADGVDLMMKMTNQGVLPRAWQDIDVSHMSAALATLDNTYSGYLDWRELLLSLAAVSIPSIHTATPAQVAAQATQLAAVDADMDGYITQQEFEGVTWWFEPQPQKVQAAEEAMAAAAAEIKGDVAGQQAAENSQTGDEHCPGNGEFPCQWAESVLRDVERCKAFKQLLWDTFKQNAPVPVRQPSAAAAAASAAVSPAAAATPASPKTGKTGANQSKASSATGSKRGSQSEGGVPAPNAAVAAAALAPAAAAAGTSADAEEVGGVAEVCCIDAMLLYLCADRDLYQGITKAIAAVTAPAAAGAVVDATAVVKMCYPLLAPEQAASIQRAPLSAAQITAAVAAASAELSPATGGGGIAAPTAGHSSSGAATAQPTQTATPVVAVKSSQLMYAAACERVVTLLLQRYQWKDIYIAARL